MANEQNRCFIWGTPAEQTIRYPDWDIPSEVRGSPRTGGNYSITFQAINYVGTLDDSQRARLTTMIIEERRKTGQTPLVTPKLIEDAKRADPLPVYARAERLLRYLVGKSQIVGDAFSLHSIENDPVAYAWTESFETRELHYFFNYLSDMKWINGLGSGFQVTVSGYQYVAEKSTKTDLSQCFVAMWFDDSMKQAYEEGIERAVKECGYTPMKINEKQHFNKICDEAIAEIRRSRFVVADFTHGDHGARGNVFYEAGFAHALDLPVIFTCQKDQEKSLHFDTRQYSHIFWKDKEDLYTQLRVKIGALMGDYKAEPAHAANE